MASAMESRSVVKWRQALVMAQCVLVSAYAGCGTLSGAPALSADSAADVKRAAVAKRAEDRWQLLIKGDLAGAYEYLSPGSRSTMSYEQYRAKHRVGFYRAAKVDSVTCEDAVCTADLKLTYDARQLKGITTPITEKWVIEQGQVWFVEVR